jgi:hypothetical protein
VSGASAAIGYRLPVFPLVRRSRSIIIGGGVEAVAGVTPDSNDGDEASGVVSRRTLLRRAGGVAGGLVAGSALAGQVAASGDGCGDGCVCWVDVKPSSCPNSVNPNSQGVLPVSAGWPNFDVDTVELIPVKGSYDAAFDCCQDFQDPSYRDDGAELCELAKTSDRSASPVWHRVEDVDGDGDRDSKFKFEVSDLELEPDDTYLVLKGESSTSDCTYYGIDSVRVVGGNGGQEKAADASGRGK